MRKIFYKLSRILFGVLPFLLLAAAFLTVLFFPDGDADGNQSSAPRVVRVWHIDTFEGGKGSRASFLRDAARILEKKDKNVYYLISPYTAEGARAAAQEGDLPDMLSFGVGLGDFMEQSLPLARMFAGGETGGDCLAYPWCAGRYSLFSLDENFDEAGTVAISAGGSNLAEVAAYLNNVEGERIESGAAYVGFLNKKYRYLLGTQRDECRFATRGVTVYRKELNEYCDLYQYIACLNAKKASDCKKFIDVLLGKEVQGKLSQIGMFSLSQTEARKTVSVFASDDALVSLNEAVRAKSDLKNIDKFLKNI
ncbi:MAG: hypothetical protein HFE28_06085 [Clostridia bacterium]|nr:hypothetical protein [Clostridia bacterium]